MTAESASQAVAGVREARRGQPSQRDGINCGWPLVHQKYSCSSKPSSPELKVLCAQAVKRLAMAPPRECPTASTLEQLPSLGRTLFWKTSVVTMRFVAPANPVCT